MTENKRFKSPFVRDRNVIIEDIEYAESILKRKPNDEKLKRIIKDLNDELSYTKHSLFERIFKR